MNVAILLSGGKGSRMGEDIPKQYIEVSGRMIITYACEPLIKSNKIDLVVIVADRKWRKKILSEIEQLDKNGTDILFASPGGNRQLSILHGLEKTEELIKERAEHPDEEATVLIHDAARPLLSEQQIDACYEALAGHDGVMPVLPMKDTVYLGGEDGGIQQLLPRDRVFAGQAPELFLYRPYYDAVKALLPDRIKDIKGSTEPAVIAGMDIVMISGDEGNYKITTRPDLLKFRMKAYEDDRNHRFEELVKRTLKEK